MNPRTPKEHCEVVLSAIIPDKPVYLDKASRALTVEHFGDPVLRALFVMLVKYMELTGAVMQKQDLADQLSDVDSGKANLLLETYDFLLDLKSGEADFLWSLDKLLEESLKKSVGETLNRAMEILVTGIENKQGEIVKGQEEARKYVIHELSVLDREAHVEDSPEGDMREEQDDMLRDYEERKRLRALGMSEGIMFGIPELDENLGGLQNGELDLLVGYSSSGKTSLSVQLAWNASVNQGKNVVIATTETLRPQVRRKLIARHSRLSKFSLRNGLNSRDIKNGTLTDTDELILKDVIKDFTTSSNYGKCYILQVPNGTNMSLLDLRLSRLQREFDIDLGIVDYLGLFRPDRKRPQTREELASIMIDAKRIATSFDKGRGLPLVSPWQCSRAAWMEAQKVKQYTLAALAETAEAERSADIVVSMLEPLNNDSRFSEIKAQILKNRDGETNSSIMLDADYATSYYVAGTGAGDIDGLLDFDDL